MQHVQSFKTSMYCLLRFNILWIVFFTELCWNCHKCCPECWFWSCPLDSPSFALAGWNPAGRDWWFQRLKTKLLYSAVFSALASFPQNDIHSSKIMSLSDLQEIQLSGSKVSFKIGIYQLLKVYLGCYILVPSRIYSVLSCGLSPWLICKLSAVCRGLRVEKTCCYCSLVIMGKCAMLYIAKSYTQPCWNHFFMWKCMPRLLHIPTGFLISLCLGFPTHSFTWIMSKESWLPKCAQIKKTVN